MTAAKIAKLILKYRLAEDRGLGPLIRQIKKDTVRYALAEKKHNETFSALAKRLRISRTTLYAKSTVLVLVSLTLLHCSHTKPLPEHYYDLEETSANCMTKFPVTDEQVCQSANTICFRDKNGQRCTTRTK